MSWCANECGYIAAGVIPKFAGCVWGVQWFKERGLWQDNSYEPRPGDIIFFDWDSPDGSSGSQDGESDHTADGFSEQKIEQIIQSLRDGSYQPKPVRRTYIQKKNGKTRPLGIPTFTDKLVQEVLRMILEAVYEPIFLKTSHGFRPNRSCHTALGHLKYQFHGARWFVEGDIKGCFDNIDHAVK